MVCNHMEPFRLFSISIRVELIYQAVIIVDIFWLVIKKVGEGNSKWLYYMECALMFFLILSSIEMYLILY